MHNALADALIAKSLSIAKIGQELSDSGSNTEQDAARIERLYFEIGSLVLANIGSIAAALYHASALSILLSTPIPSAEELDRQAKTLNALDVTKN